MMDKLVQMFGSGKFEDPILLVESLPNSKNPISDIRYPILRENQYDFKALTYTLLLIALFLTILFIVLL